MDELFCWLIVMKLIFIRLKKKKIQNELKIASANNMIKIYCISKEKEY